MALGRTLREPKGRTQPARANGKSTGDYPNQASAPEGPTHFRQYVVGTGPTARLSGQAQEGSGGNAGTRRVMGASPLTRLGEMGNIGHTAQPGPPLAEPARASRHMPKVIGKGRQQGGGG